MWTSASALLVRMVEHARMASIRTPVHVLLATQAQTVRQVRHHYLFSNFDIVAMNPTEASVSIFGSEASFEPRIFLSFDR